jgi:hypothetical protein
MNIYIEDNLGAGVYMIQNLTNGKMYIGQSTNITKRLTNHAVQLRSGKHIIKKLQSDYDSGNQFTYKVLFKVVLRLCTGRELVLFSSIIS